MTMPTPRRSKLRRELQEILYTDAQASPIDVESLLSKVPEGYYVGPSAIVFISGTVPSSEEGAFSFSGIVPAEVVRREEIEQLKEEITRLKERVTVLETQLEALAAEEVVELRTIPREQAKEEIRQLFESGETLYYSDIVHRLGLDIDLVIELCNELEVEGKVMTIGDTA